MERKKIVSEFLNIKMFQDIQDRCSEAMGFAFVTVDYRGIPLTEYSGFTEHCKLGRKSQGFAEMCEQCDAHGGLHAAITGQPYIYRCHAGLVDFALPLILDGSYIGAVLGGQVRLSQEEERDLQCILPQKEKMFSNKEINLAYERATIVPFKKIKAAVEVVRDMILFAMEAEYKKRFANELENKEQELISERALSSNLESSIVKQEIDSMRNQEKFQFFFFVMNIITNIAHSEKAVNTANVCYDFVDMMRYAMENDRKISTLGEELNYIRCMLNIQAAWRGELFKYSISVPNRYLQTTMPFMLLQILCDIVLNANDISDSGYNTIDIYVQEEGEDLLVQIFGSGEWTGVEDIEAQIPVERIEKNISLSFVDKVLRRVFGKKYFVAAGLRNDGQDGSYLTFKIPLNFEKN